jgi:hypothetical protein
MTIKKSDIAAYTYCDFGTPPRKDVMRRHGSVDKAKRAFARVAKIYADLWGWRCWQETAEGEIINDRVGKRGAVSSS